MLGGLNRYLNTCLSRANDNWKETQEAYPKSIGPRTQEEEKVFVPDITEPQLLENPSIFSLVPKQAAVNAGTERLQRERGRDCRIVNRYLPI